MRTSQETHETRGRTQGTGYVVTLWNGKKRRLGYIGRVQLKRRYAYYDVTLVRMK